MTGEPLRGAAARLAAAGIEGARFEAQLLLALALGLTRTQVLAGTHPEPTPGQRAEFERLVGERARRVPLAYLRGTQEFYGLDFAVSPAVLVPRPETELLVGAALLRLRARLQHQETARLADAGTGSGCVAVAVLVHEARAQAAATDLSPGALAVAEANARRHGVAGRLRLVRADLFAPLAAGTFDVLASNPPYVAAPEIPTLQAEVRGHEPRLALDGGADGLGLYPRLARQAFRALRPGGWLCAELGRGQAEAVSRLFRAAGFADVSALDDFAGIPRVVCGQTP